MMISYLTVIYVIRESLPPSGRVRRTQEAEEVPEVRVPPRAAGPRP